jgi:hypothetical protein
LIDILCEECGGAVPISVHGVKRREDLTCTWCGAALDLRSKETRRLCDRARRVWPAEREQDVGESAGEASWASRRCLLRGVSSL